MAPVFAVARLLGRLGLTFEDIDYFEIHEAFAGTVLSHLAAWEDEEFCRERLGLDGALGKVDRAKLNVNGSSLAAGHPFAATGGRIVATLAKQLHERGEVGGRPARGLISVCAAGGLGVAFGRLQFVLDHDVEYAAFAGQQLLRAFRPRALFQGKRVAGVTGARQHRRFEQQR